MVELWFKADSTVTPVRHQADASSGKTIKIHYAVIHTNQSLFLFTPPNKKVYYVHKNKHIVMNKPLLRRILSLSALLISLILPSYFVQAQTAITIGETTVLTSNDSGNGNLLIAQQATLSQIATIQSLSFYVTTAGGDLRLGIYDATGPNGGPGAKKAETNSFTPTTGWNTANVITPVSLPTGTYWLTYLPSSSSLGFRLAYTGSAKWYSYTYGVMPTTYSTAPTAGTYHWSFYATLNTSTSPDTTAPTTPTNLSATAVSSSQINLSWTASTDNVGVTGYNVYRNGTQIASVAATSYNDTGLVASTAYSYTVSAYDAAGYSSVQSASASATTQAVSTDITPPTTPTGLTATAVSSSQISLSWTASTDNVGVTGYDIYRGGTPLTTVAATSYSNTGLTASTLYSYTVRAKDAAGNNSAQTASVSATTQTQSTTTALSTLAASMQPGTWAELNTQGFGQSLLDDVNGSFIVQYTDDAQWDPIARQVYFIGASY